MHDGALASAAPVRLASSKLRDMCDSLVTAHTLVLDRDQAVWQLPIIRRFINLRELRVDLRKSCVEPQDLYAVLADVVRTVPELQTLHVLCGLSDGAHRLALPVTGAHRMWLPCLSALHDEVLAAAGKAWCHIVFFPLSASIAHAAIC